MESSRKVFPKIVIKDLREFPFRINVDKSIEKGIINLINHIIETKKRFHSARMEQDKVLYERQIKLVDAQIDRLVYDLYGLTDEEIEIVEKSL